MKNMLAFGSILAAIAATIACGDSTGDGGSGGATTQSSTAPASGSGSTSTKTTATTGTGASTNATSGNSTAASSGSGSGQSTAASSGSGAGTCDPTGDVCQDCVFMNCCDEYTACIADAACTTCMMCLQTTGAACLFNGMCDSNQPAQGAFINCATQCQAQCT